jgi:hypothetical protein
MMALLYILVAGVVARWVITAIKGGGGGEGYELASRDAQVQRLREEVDGLQSEVRRLGEEQSFMVRLLSEGRKPDGALSAPEQATDSNLEMP